jgi:hypothetical protein
MSWVRASSSPLKGQVIEEYLAPIGSLAIYMVVVARHWDMLHGREGELLKLRLDWVRGMAELNKCVCRATLYFMMASAFLVFFPIFRPKA